MVSPRRAPAGVTRCHTSHRPPAIRAAASHRFLRLSRNVQGYTTRMATNETAAHPRTMLGTAAGSAPSVSTYRHLNRLGLRIVAVDCAPLSVGFVYADAAYTVPRADDPAYIDTLVEICSQQHVDFFPPSLDEELLLVCRARAKFEAVGTKVLVSPARALRICTDKLATHSFFVEHGIPTVPTVAARDLERRSLADYPQIIKPRRGRGGANVFAARDWEETQFFARYVGDAVIQPRISGVEYTVDVLADYTHEPVIVAPRRRLAVDSGICCKGVTDWNEQVVSWTCEIVRALGLVGPANIQCFVTDGGEIMFTEVNARLAGTAILSQAAGIPLLEGIVALAFGEQPPRHVGRVEERILLRYWDEAFLDASQAAELGWTRT